MLERLERLSLIDHHCHGVLRRDLDRAEFESLLTEARAPGPLGGSLFDSQAGFALRRWCAPVLDLETHADPDDYLARRAELGADEVNRRFLEAAGLDALCVDTGYTPEPLTAPAELGGLAGARAHEIVRLERVAEDTAADGTDAARFADDVRTRLEARVRAGAVGAKSVAAYRAGLELAGERPSDLEVAAAAGRLLREEMPPRVADETLHRFLVWCAADLGLPVQFHVGYGDADADLRRGDPLLLTGLLRELAPTGTPVLLLHNYPYHRQAGYLAQVFPNVFVDAGLATHNLGHRAPALIAELLELAPFGKVLFSSDAYGLAEFYHLGALLFRRGLARLLRSGATEGAWTERDALRVAELAAAGNARRVYRL
ncbi:MULTISPECIES: amidohydrolase family protein [Thermomonosporaceae]|uniref:amidohydrolase family protein n=1 Tax=Thermomonosporaceae TaxID=2012 RepID=UPI00255AB603|nr:MULTISPECIES: amidohydrolase family protein [Thermomonosporaceae]MDL4774379.1 amidohydrolase family protein [Actinomadura xylanilytica]